MRWLLLLLTAVCWAQDAQQQPTLEQQIEQTQQDYYRYSRLARQYQQRAQELSTSDPSSLNISQAEYEQRQQATQDRAIEYQQKAEELYNRLQELYREQRQAPVPQ